MFSSVGDDERHPPLQERLDYVTRDHLSPRRVPSEVVPDDMNRRQGTGFFRDSESGLAYDHALRQFPVLRRPGVVAMRPALEVYYGSSLFCVGKPYKALTGNRSELDLQ